MFSCLKRTLCCFVKEKDLKTDVYVLKLKDDKYYVGESSDVKRRIWSHKNDNGSAWTKKYNVIEQIDKLDVSDNLYELAQTLEMMRVYGINNVRGSLFTKPFPLDRFEKIMATQLYCELHGYCRKCGSNDHFIGNCKGDKVVDWVNQFGGELEYKELLVPKDRICLKCSESIASSPSNYKYCRTCFLKINGYH